MAIAIKIKGCSAQEIKKAYENVKPDGDYSIKLIPTKEGTRSTSDIVHLVTENYGIILLVLGKALILWNEIMKVRRANLDQKKYELDVRKHVLSMEKFKLEEKKYELEKKKYETEVNNKPQIAVIQQNIGDDIFLPLDTENELELEQYFTKNAMSLNIENIKSIFIK